MIRSPALGPPYGSQKCQRFTNRVGRLAEMTGFEFRHSFHGDADSGDHTEEGSSDSVAAGAVKFFAMIHEIDFQVR